MPGIHPTTYLFAARALRDFGDGFVAILLPVYLLLLGFSPLQVGIIATASLFGSALLTIAVGFLGARRNLRWLLLASASLMTATGVAMSLADDYWLLLVIAFAGTINPSAGSVSVFVPLEHAALTREVNGWLILIPEPAKQSSEAAKLDLLTLEPGVQSTVGHRGRRIAAIERVCLGYESVVGRAAVARGLRGCLLRFTGPVWITRHHRHLALKVF